MAGSSLSSSAALKASLRPPLPQRCLKKAQVRTPGSVTEKASAFFELFAGPARPDAVESYPHRIPISRVAELAGGPQEEEALAALGRVCGSLPPPRESPALEIEVWANEYGELAGRAFVRSLWPFVRSSPLLQERELLLSAGSAFYIWVEDEGTPPRCVGELRLGISWTPRNELNPAIGTLVLCAGALKLFSAERLSRPAQPWFFVDV